MGCLIEILLMPFEAILEFILNTWISLMLMVVPRKSLKAQTRIILKIIIGIFSLALLVTFTIGCLAAAFTEATVIDLWKLIFIPLGISVFQIILGCVIRFSSPQK